MLNTRYKYASTVIKIFKTIHHTNLYVHITSSTPGSGCQTLYELFTAIILCCICCLHVMLDQYLTMMLQKFGDTRCTYSVYLFEQWSRCHIYIYIYPILQINLQNTMFHSGYLLTCVPIKQDSHAAYFHPLSSNL